MIDVNDLQEFSTAENDDNKLILVHVTTEEIKKLNLLQNEEIFTNLEGEDGSLIRLPTYTKLYEEIISNPELRNEFITTAEEFMRGGLEAEQADDESRVYEMLKSELPMQDIERKTETDSKFANVLKGLGDDNDRQLALFPKGLADFFDLIKGGTEVNQNTGLREYGLLGKILGSVVGFLVGGPAGAGLVGGGLGSTIGSGIGSYAGARLGGAKPREALKYGLGGAGLNFLGGANGISSALSSGVGGLNTGLGNLLNPLTRIFGGSTAGISNAAQTAQLAHKIAQGTNAANATTGLSQLFTPNNLLLGTGSLALLNKGYKQDQLERAQMLDREKQEKLNRYNAFAKFFGDDVTPIKPNQKLNTMLFDELSEDELPEKQYFIPESRYAKGGAVKGTLAKMKEVMPKSRPHAINGPGSGTEDKIPAKLKYDDYIIDATTVSHAGNGSNKAGQKAFEDLEKIITRKGKIRHPDIKSENVLIPAALSDGERRIDRDTVATLGNGDPNKGTRLLDRLRDNLRKHKSKYKGSIPPESYNLLKYMR